MLDNIRIVLVETSHPGNIGAAARAMKNMGLSTLYLVRPRHFPHPDAVARASRADDILTHAVVSDTLEDAITDCSLVLGTSVRLRTAERPVWPVREAAHNVHTESGKVAILFGSERIGLENHHLAKCHAQVYIPTISDYSSLNLGAAVQIVAYELYMASHTIALPAARVKTDLATARDLEGLYGHIEAAMIDIGFLNPDNPRTMMQRIRRIFQRARLDTEDVNLLRGMMKAVQKMQR